MGIAEHGLRRDNRPIDAAGPAPPSPRPPAPAPRGALARALEWIVPRENPGGVVYGLIAIGALLAAESGRHETYPDTLLSAVIAACLYWLAHSYSRLLGRRLARGERLDVRRLLTALADDQALLRGAAVPLLVLAAAWATGAAQRTAVLLALWSAVGSLVAFEVLAGIRARASRRELALEAAVGAGMGLAVLSLKIVLH